MELWQILGLGGVRRGRAAAWERLEDRASHHRRERPMRGVPGAPWGQGAQVFGQPTLRDNGARRDDERLQQSNARRAAASALNSLEQHGLNRCPAVGLEGYLRYVGYGVMSDNLHRLGRELLARERASAARVRLAACSRPPRKPNPSPTGVGLLAVGKFGGLRVFDIKTNRSPLVWSS